MDRGTRVQTLNDGTVHPKYRGMQGTVVGDGSNGTIRVALEHHTTPVDLDKTVLEIIPSLPSQETSAQV